MSSLVKIETWKIESYDIDQLAREKYGIKDFEWVAIEETGNGYRYLSDMDGELESWHANTEEKLRAGEFVMFSGRVLLDMLIKDGHLPAGNYLIDHTW